MIELRRSTARNGSDPTSRTEVKPASKVLRAFTTAAKAWLKGVSLKSVDLVVAVRTRIQMSVAIDQARENRGLREVDHFSARRNLEIGGRGNALDALTFDHDDHIFTNIVARGIKQTAREDITDCGSGLIAGRRGGACPNAIDENISRQAGKSFFLR